MLSPCCWRISMSNMSDRERAVEKVRKLLAMAYDGRGNMHEAEAAMRQATALMSKFNIEAAEAQLTDLCSDEPDLAQEHCVPNYDKGARPAKSIPAWVGVIAVGVARLCQVKADGSRTKEGIASVRFSGYATDVVFATWLLPILCRAVFNEARAQLGRATLAERETFRRAAAGQLQRRLKALANEEKTQVSSSSTALVVIDKKQQVIEQAFGEMKVSSVDNSERARRDASAAAAGYSYGRSVPIPRGRPVSDGSSTTGRIAA